MEYLNKLISRYKRIISLKTLENTYEQQYAFVGFGSHCVNNLLPIVHHLQLPLKYICCTSERKAALIPKKYKGVKGTVSLQEVLDDNAISAVLVASSPHSHFNIASEVIKSGKSLFIEKPPCEDARELELLTDTVRLYGAKHIVVGLQRRFAPATRILQKRLRAELVCHYHYRYLTGLYPEGDALSDLFIHPLDYISFLFGEAKIRSASMVRTKSGGQTRFIILEHQHSVGVLELSTNYSWDDAQETLSISTDKGLYVLDNMERLDFHPRHSSLCGVPLEKIFRNHSSIINLYGRNGFVPTIANNHLFSQGFFSEIEIFANMVEGKTKDLNLSDFDSLKKTYSLLSKVKELEMSGKYNEQDTGLGML